MGTVDWVRVTSAHPCPVCGRTHYCSVSVDGGLVYCTKEPSNRPGSDGAGWIHKMGENGHRNGHRNGHAAVGVRTTRYAVVAWNGALEAVHVRRDMADGSKRIHWEQPDGTTGLGGRKPADLPLYQSDMLVEVPHGGTVFVCEGEKATDALRGLGLHAVGTVTGAAGTPGDDALSPLIALDVVLWPDNDEIGRQHMQRIAQKLLARGTRARILAWPDAPDKGDAADFVAAGLGKDELRRLYAAARVVEEPTNDAPVGVVEKRLSDVAPETVLWLWRGRVPFGKITVLDGDPGLGKSTITLDVAARLTRGDLMPDQTMGDRDGPRSVLLMTVEDGLADTIRPRLEALGADLTRVYALEEVPGEDGKAEMPAIPRDLAIIEERIRARDVGLVIIDPLIAFLGDSQQTNSWKDQDVRRALGPFAHMLERTGCATLLIRHLNKGSGGNPVYRGGGSIGIIGAARSGLMVAKDQDDDTGARRILVPTKANLSAPAKALAYHMEQADNGSVKVVWEGETEHTALGLLAEPLPEEERSALAEAIDFLKDELYGNPVLTEEIKRRAKTGGISERTLARARRKLNVKSERLHGPTGPWSLRLPVLAGTAAAEKHGADE